MTSDGSVQVEKSTRGTKGKDTRQNSWITVSLSDIDTSKIRNSNSQNVENDRGVPKVRRSITEYHQPWPDLENRYRYRLLTDLTAIKPYDTKN